MKAMMSESPEKNALVLILKLKVMHPEIEWAPFEIGDYYQYAELGAPDILVSFGSEDEQLECGLVDAYADMFGKACAPSHWGICEEAAQMIQEFNQIFMAKYPCGNAPRSRVSVGHMASPVTNQ
ncbi:conserved hypothetical protein [Pseudomonas veronii]|uniref:hypothetical protein n=1 Tax=Pseudomonas veronii TaxID=76761 RepID=UPI001752B3E5|nr:hypothetical protein [Pseudomonas veronii]CAD0264274.1 conserved hypothetical protein [Pseudomonas veronii]